MKGFSRRALRSQTFPHERLLWTRASGSRGCWVVAKQASFGSWLTVRGGNAFRVTPNDTLWLVLLWCSPAAMCPSCYTELSHSLSLLLQFKLIMSHFTYSKQAREKSLMRSLVSILSHKQQRGEITKKWRLNRYGSPFSPHKEK